MGEISSGVYDFFVFGGHKVAVSRIQDCVFFCLRMGKTQTLSHAVLMEKECNYKHKLAETTDHSRQDKSVEEVDPAGPNGHTRHPADGTEGSEIANLHPSPVTTYAHNP